MVQVIGDIEIQFGMKNKQDDILYPLEDEDYKDLDQKIYNKQN